jgi:hypothetical protein
MTIHHYYCCGDYEEEAVVDVEGAVAPWSNFCSLPCLDSMMSDATRNTGSPRAHRRPWFCWVVLEATILPDCYGFFSTKFPQD